jgi:hypothetical protein
MNAFSFVALLLMAGISFPLAFWIARLCLGAMVRVLDREPGAIIKSGK